MGIAVLGLAAMIMPWLAAQKRQLSITTGSGALRADAAESAVCGDLALIALAGLAVNAVWRGSWAGPLAALAFLPLIIREGWEAWKGKPCCDWRAWGEARACPCRMSTANSTVDSENTCS